MVVYEKEREAPKPPFYYKGEELFSIKTTVEISTAHRLLHHKGACNKLHGHNYYITAILGYSGLNSADMVMDFKDFKSIVENKVNEWDHKTVLNEKDPLVVILQRQASADATITLAGEPTAEKMAEVLHYALSCVFNRVIGAHELRVEVQETAGNIVSYGGK